MFFLSGVFISLHGRRPVGLHRRAQLAARSKSVPLFLLSIKLSLAHINAISFTINVRIYSRHGDKKKYLTGVAGDAILCKVNCVYREVRREKQCGHAFDAV
jgi:hypothetical protein